MKLLTATLQLQMVLWLLLLPPTLVLCRAPVPMPTAATAATTMATTDRPPPHCPTMCGNVSIPYPFGIGEGCSWRESFAINCSQRRHSPPIPYFRGYEVINITLETGEMRVVTTAVAHICYNSSSSTSSTSSHKFNFTGSPFLISPTRNQFTGIGCDTTVELVGGRGTFSGCVTTCKGLEDAAGDGGHSCTGQGCCQIPTPSGLDVAQFGWGSAPANSPWNYSSCSYAFVAEKGWYNFNRIDLNGTVEMAFNRRFGKMKVPLVLNWDISNENSACASSHSERASLGDGRGSFCKCSNGYSGNPYTKEGCQNIDECKLRKSDPMKYESIYYCPKHSRCIDTDGNYECKCTIGRKRISGQCRPVFSTTTGGLASLVAMCTVPLLAVILWFVCRKYKHRMQRIFFNRNGGEILKRMNIKTFTEKQLEKITNNYNNLIGSGKFGKVFMGTTDDKRRVAVKRSILRDKPWNGHDHELASELAIQFWMSHTNLVRLIGCCLETNVPMLVYEYVSNGSLYNVLHGGGIEPRTLPLLARLDIAIGSAKALAYMHSHGGHNPIIHGDVKTGNILLGDNLTPKVSDFGTSKLASIARHTNNSVVGDMSYIDPIYKKTGRFTEKSDVYSFGVVLLELITRKEAKYDGDKSLPIDFVKSCKENGNGRALYDRDIFSDENAQSHRYIDILDKIGALAIRCLMEDVDERPTMAEVVEELKLTKSSGYGGSSSDASESHIEEASKACMLMSMSLRLGLSQRVCSPGSARLAPRSTRLINSNKQHLSIDLPESHRARLTPKLKVPSPLA